MITNAARKSTAPYITTASATQEATQAIVLLKESDLAPFALETLGHRIQMLSWLPNNWDGFGSAKPNTDAIHLARASVAGFFDAATKLTEYGWSDPHVSANESGDVVFEWWQGSKKITLYVRPTATDFVLVWGDNMDTEMDEGTIITLENFADIWDWLHT